MVSFISLTALMAVSCNLAVNECSRSPVIVQKIMLRDDIDSTVMKELKMMFMQFKAMKIKLSASGMYMIDLSFLCDTVSAAIYYTIILLQL
jgi:hypothetical protein